MKRKGFTMIELMLAMGFLATLLITIALLVNMIAGIYQKGLSLRAVNATGRQLVDELSRVVGGSPISSGINPVDLNGNGILNDDDIAASLRTYFVSNTETPMGGDQLNGAFCTGSYSYIWNTRPSYILWRDDDDASLVLQLRYEADPDDQPGVLTTEVHKMARVRDVNRSVCSTIAGDPADPGGNPPITSGPITVSGKPISLISDDEADLVLYDFTVFPATQHTITKQTFYSATFILGTVRGGININSNGNYCNENDSPLLGASGLLTDFNYCAVNKFNFAMRATGYTQGEDPYGQ